MSNANKNSELDTAVDDIASSESDDLLERDDRELESEFDSLKEKSFKEKAKAFFKDLWQNPKKRWGMFFGLAFLLMALFIIPVTRYFFLNNVGVRSSSSVRVLDQSTGQPLKNVEVSLANAQGKTDDNGVAKLEHLKLGSTTLYIKKRAFAKVQKDITLGWGSNPLADVELQPVGVQYKFKVTDFLSDKPIEKAEAVSGEYSAFSDKDGLAVLTIDKPSEETINITLKADSYRDEQVNQDTENKDEQTVHMVPARKHLFISKRSGKFDLYKIDLDGKNESLVLSGTGNERNDIVLVEHPEKDIAVMVSSRGVERNNDGYLLSTMTLVDLTGKEVQTNELAVSEKVQVIGWSGDWLVYVKVKEGASGATADRNRLMSYNIDTGESKQLASSNYFNDVLLVGNQVFYAPSTAYQKQKVGFYKVDADGKNQSTVFDQETWNIFRTDYDTLAFLVQSDWYEYDLNDKRVLAASGAPSIQLTRIYIDSRDKKHSLWIDQRDGKGALLSYDTASKEDKTIRSQSGLTYPTAWVSNSAAIYRVNTDQETADYVVSLNGGEPKKIVDVTNTGGIDRWYYY